MPIPKPRHVPTAENMAALLSRAEESAPKQKIIEDHKKCNVPEC
jgi:hypothetical protein